MSQLPTFWAEVGTEGVAYLFRPTEAHAHDPLGVEWDLAVSQLWDAGFRVVDGDEPIYTLGGYELYVAEKR